MKSAHASKNYPAAVEEVLIRWGRNIHTARLRRNMRLQDLAERVGISRFLMSDIEKGKPSAAIVYYMTALWAMGLLDAASDVGDPEQDLEGKTLENLRASKRAGKIKKELDNDF